MYCEKCGNFIPEGQICGCSDENTQVVNNYDNDYSYYNSQQNNFNSQQAYYAPNYAVSGIGLDRSVLKWFSLALAVLVFIFHLFDQYKISVSNGFKLEFSFGDFQSLTNYAAIIFVIYLGCFFAGASEFKAVSVVRRIAQIAFFAIMFLAPIMFVVRVASILGNFDMLFEAAEDEGFKIETSMIVGWWLTVIFSFIGFIVSLIPEKNDK